MINLHPKRKFDTDLCFVGRGSHIKDPNSGTTSSPSAFIVGTFWNALYHHVLPKSSFTFALDHTNGPPLWKELTGNEDTCSGNEVRNQNA
jgi:hypothetical protein